jgi:predicted dehydrogenase
MSQDSPFRVAIVGCGNISRAYGNSLNTRPEKVQILGAYDIDSERANAYTEEFGGQAYSSLEAVLGDGRVEAVVNLTIHSAHAEVTEAALKAGKHVHVEKPLATNRQDGQMVVNLAEEKGLRLSASPFTFLGEGQQTVLRSIQSGQIGQVLTAYAEMNWARIERWHSNPVPFYQQGVGPMLDVGVYALTFLTSVLGRVKDVQGHAEICQPERRSNTGESYRVTTPDQVTGFLHFDSGITARLTASFLGFSKQVGAEFHGETGSIFISSSHDFNAAVELHTFDHGWQPIPYVAEPFAGVEWGRAVFQMADAVRKDAPQRCTGRQANHVLEICLGILDSAEQGGAVVPIESTFQPPISLY